MRDGEHMYLNALNREVGEETGLDLKTMPPEDVFELPSFHGIKEKHKNFAVYVRQVLREAAPEERCARRGAMV